MDVQSFLPMLPLWYAVFLLSLTAHEAAHALVAHLGGDDTAYRAGQVSLNPIPHMRRDPIGTILVPIVTFFLHGGRWMIGWASAPYDPLWEDRHPKRAGLMALAGPAANLVLASVALLVLRIGIGLDWWRLNLDDQGYLATSDWIAQLVVPAGLDPSVLDGLARVLSVLFGLNLLLCVFNLMPIWPLDGGTVIAGFFRPARRFRDWLRGTPLGFIAGLLVAWKLLEFVFYPVFFLAIRLLL